ncbi:rhomboid family intramembrane serine protease [Hyalangium sp.]|uniref:rhomboid family intramembrane serine protease n=1 Tax=Hyalangium sp. TaxID=2028555 RepID=UPI002D2FF7D4|nr:rhomboid family intramembrane serine protease [Hyalangium sp.]HYH98246.1 rhomboid family intramembrane serine protease [Hyalangium sp.]
MSDQQHLEVMRGSRKVLGGTLDDLVALAKAGKLRPRDQIGGVTASGPVDLHSVPELARLVPTYSEYLVSRSLRALVIFDIFIGSIMALVLAVALSSARKGAPVREILFTVVLGVAIFGLPILPLARRRKKLRTMRETGDVSGIIPDPTPEDGALRLYLARPGRATWVLVGSIVLPFVLSFLLPPQGLEAHFAKVNDRIGAGELWRLVTPMFLHAGLGHLIFNFSALSEFGRLVENLYGWRRLLLVYFSAGIVGFVASFIATPATSVGASGGILGLIGVLFAVGLRYRYRWPATARKRLIVEMAVCIGINGVLGLLATFIDNAAHFGGLITGIACGMVMDLQPEAAVYLKGDAEPQAAANPIPSETR